MDSGKSTQTAPLLGNIQANCTFILFVFVCVPDVELSLVQQSLKMNLHNAAEAGDLERVKILLGQGDVDKDEDDRYCRTALMNAARKGHFAIVQYLVEQGADKEIANNFGETPLVLACANGHTEVTRYLLEQGSNRDKVGYGDNTSLHAAARQGHLEVAMVLMNYGADLNAMNEDNQLPIDVANNEEMRQAILDEPRRRDQRPRKRCIEQDRHPNAAAATTSAGEEGEESNTCPEQKAALTAEEARILAEINEDSEPSGDEADG